MLPPSLVNSDVARTKRGSELAQSDWVRDPPLPIEKLVRPDR